jgi:hypothetical protein
MGICEVPHATDLRCAMGSSPETELRLSSLSSLVCDLLKENQELRNALREARLSLTNNEEA